MRRRLFLLGGLAGSILSAVTPVAQETEIEGLWLVEDIDNAGVIDNLQTTLEVRIDGSVGGNGGCNRYTGTATISGEMIAFGSMATTMMACVPAVMDQEKRFFSAIMSVRTWRIDPETGLLYFINDGGADVIRFSRME